MINYQDLCAYGSLLRGGSCLVGPKILITIDIGWTLSQKNLTFFYF